MVVSRTFNRSICCVPCWFTSPPWLDLPPITSNMVVSLANDPVLFSFSGPPLSIPRWCTPGKRSSNGNGSEKRVQSLKYTSLVFSRSNQPIMKILSGVSRTNSSTILSLFRSCSRCLYVLQSIRSFPADSIIDNKLEGWTEQGSPPCKEQIFLDVGDVKEMLNEAQSIADSSGRDIMSS